MQTVFVLGAGFTRSFCPGSPLLIGDYLGAELRAKFKLQPTANRVLEAEAALCDKGGDVDIERLMTRVAMLMPYDDERDQAELATLLIELKGQLTEKIAAGTRIVDNPKLLSEFAELCFNQHSTCISFNYDLTLDRALWDVKKSLANGWHAAGGYGFLCNPVTSATGGIPSPVRCKAAPLLKLHGSINWRIRFGAATPLQPSSICYEAPWLQSEVDWRRYFEPSPLLIPPVLDKSSIRAEPILRMVWVRAREELQKAESVTFIGYSLPQTDLAARYLFSETCRSKPVTVVSLGKNRQLEESYSSVFSNVTFVWDGALQWIEKLVKSP